VGNRSGTTINWINDIDIGATHGVKNAAEIEAVGGDAGRAVGFLGSDRPGDYQRFTFRASGMRLSLLPTMVRKLTTVNATPTIPCKHGGYLAARWEKTQRNLLDFNEITVRYTAAVTHHAVAVSSGLLSQ